MLTLFIQSITQVKDKVLNKIHGVTGTKVIHQVDYSTRCLISNKLWRQVRDHNAQINTQIYTNHETIRGI